MASLSQQLLPTQGPVRIPFGARANLYSRFQLQFVKSEFAGLLPKPFDSHNGTSGIPSAMNNMNQEEFSRYVSIQYELALHG